MRWIVALLIAGCGAVAATDCLALMPWSRPNRNALASESRLLVDLDGDGKRDSVLVQFFLGATAPKCVVLRSGKSVLTLMGDQVEPEVVVVDLDTADVRHELQFYEDGPSDDPVVTYIAMVNDSFVVLGEVGGYREESRCAGDGFVVGRDRGVVLQSWWYPRRYVLRTPSRLEPVEQSLYPMRTHVLLLDTLTLVRSPSGPRTAFRLRKGDRADLIACDDKRWVVLRDAKGRVGWFELNGYDEIVEGHRDARDVFSGLVIVD